jgi:hypothetical protein
VECGSSDCAVLSDIWRGMATRRESWQSMRAMECQTCAVERDRRNRLAAPHDPRIRQTPFVEAAYVHKNNEPKYHALLLRAVEYAKRATDTPAHILWVMAHDTPQNHAEMAVSAARMDQKRARWLQYHDQKTAGSPGLLPLYVNIPARVTETISKKLNILKHTPCKVVGWDLHPADRQRGDMPERQLEYLLLCIYIKFEKAKWKVHPRLPAAVFPLKSVKREWTVNQKTDTKASRRGFQLIPDFACTAHMVQGGNLEAELTDCGDMLGRPH